MTIAMARAPKPSTPDAKLSLELETRDVENDDRPQAALKASRYTSFQR
jgi:hypothetical protein